MIGGFTKGRALIVGAADYVKMPTLPPTVLNDVDDISALLSSRNHCGYPPDRVRLLRNVDASCVALKKALTELSRSDEDETVLFAYSGHGERIVGGPGSGSYLCPIDFDPGSPANTGIPRDELSSMLADIPAQRLVIILDACHAAGAVDMKSGGRAAMKSGFSQMDFDRLGTGSGRVLFASSREDEYSLILGGMRNSLFMHHVFEGLRSIETGRDDGTVRVLDLFDHVSTAMHGSGQHPVLKANSLEDNFPIALASRLAPTRDEWWLELERVGLELYPHGPDEQDLWSRAGGDVSVLRPGLNGRAAWHSALRVARLGGNIDKARLIETMRTDFPQNASLGHLLAMQGRGLLGTRTKWDRPT